MSNSALKIAVGILLVKEHIQRFYKKTSELEQDLNDFKKKHGYCIGRPFCMNMLKVDSKRQSCDECVKANSNPKYKKTVSAYGELRRKEKQEEKVSAKTSKKFKNNIKTLRKISPAAKKKRAA